MRLLSGLMLGLALQSIPSAGPQVINISYPGSNSAEFDAKYDDAMTSAKPRYVVLMAGATDALNEKKFLSPEQTRVHLRSMSERAQAGGATVIVLTTHDPDLTRLMQRHRLEDYGNSPPLVRLAAVNAILAALATHQGLSLVDFHAILASEGGSTPI